MTTLRTMRILYRDYARLMDYLNEAPLSYKQYISTVCRLLTADPNNRELVAERYSEYLRSCCKWQKQPCNQEFIAFAWIYQENRIGVLWAARN